LCNPDSEPHMPGTAFWPSASYFLCEMLQSLLLQPVNVAVRSVPQFKGLPTLPCSEEKVGQLSLSIFYYTSMFKSYKTMSFTSPQKKTRSLPSEIGAYF